MHNIELINAISPLKKNVSIDEDIFRLLKCLF